MTTHQFTLDIDFSTLQHQHVYPVMLFIRDRNISYNLIFVISASQMKPPLATWKRVWSDLANPTPKSWLRNLFKDSPLVCDKMALWYLQYELCCQILVLCPQVLSKKWKIWEFQIDSVVRASFFQLRPSARVKAFLSRCDLEKVFHAFISSRLDCCNALYVGVCQTSIARLQFVQNAAACLVNQHIQMWPYHPVLSSLRWFPVHFRIQIKILMFVFKAINGLAPSDLSEILTLGNNERALRSSNHFILEVPRSWHKQSGDRSFAVASSKMWNKVPPNLRTIVDPVVLKSEIKTYLIELFFST